MDKNKLMKFVGCEIDWDTPNQVFMFKRNIIKRMEK